MFLTDISIGDAAIAAILGYIVVFFGIILLQAAVVAMGKFFVARDRKAAAQAPTVAAPVPAVTSAKRLAPGSAGELKIYDVEPKTAAMIMALTADKLGKPLNELRFISIKEVK